MHLDIGNDAHFLDRAARRGVVERCGEAQTGSAFQRIDGLHRTLAESGRPHHERAPVILERPGHDLRGAGAASVDQHHDGIRRLETPRPGEIILSQGFVPALGVDDQSLGDPVIGQGHRLVEQSTGVVTQIDDHALKARRVFAAQFCKNLRKIFVGSLLKRAHPHISVSGR